MKISFIGSGGVACTTAFAMGLKGLFNEIVMLDLYTDYAKGKAIDLQQGFVLDGKDIKVVGTDNYDDIKGSDAIVITAGIANTDGTADRESLLGKNKEIMSAIAKKIKAIISTDDKQPLIIMVTNPLDVILKHFIDEGNFNKKKTIGSGNWLDTARFKYYLGKEFNIQESKIETFTVGQHGAKMVYLLSQTKIDGTPLFEYMNKNNISMDKIKKIENDSTMGGAEIIKLIVKGGTFYGPAISIYDLLDSYFNDRKKIVTASIYCDGKYDLENCCLGCPVVIGKNGVEEVKLLNLTDEEKKNLKEAYGFIKELALK